MTDTLKLYWTAFKVSLQAKFEYRVDFVLGILTSVMLQLAALSFLFVIFHQTPALAGWEPEQVILLFGLAAASLGVSELFFNHIWFVPFYVVMGDLDRLFTYPVNSLAFLLVTRPELHAFGNLVTGTGLALAALHRSGAPAWTLALVPLLALCGGVVYTGALVMAAACSFRFIGPFSMHLMIPNTLLQATRYPLNAYPVWLQYALLIVLPYGAFNYLPASLLFGKTQALWLLGAAPLSALAFLLVSHRVWQWGVNQYQSTGS